MCIVIGCVFLSYRPWGRQLVAGGSELAFSQEGGGLGALGRTLASLPMHSGFLVKLLYHKEACNSFARAFL